MINECIDFLEFPGPYSKKKWGMLYVYGLDFNQGIWLSVN